MMKTTTQHRYATRIQAVVDALSAALAQGQELPDLQQLAAIAHFSPFHFHRIYRAIAGEALGATVLRLRLQRALHLLADPGRPITQVAMDVGLGSAQSLTRLIREHLHTTPSDLQSDAVAREAALERLMRMEDARPAASPCRVEIVSLQPFRALLQSAVGTDEDLAAAYQALFERAADAGLLEKVEGIWGIEWDDRRDVPVAQRRADCLLMLGADALIPDALATLVVEGGRFARARVSGPFSGIEPMLDDMLREWWSSQDGALREVPVLFHYLDDPETTPEAALRTDIYLPLAD